MFPSNPLLCNNCIEDIVPENEHQQLLHLKRNLANLYLTGSNEVSTVCASILCKSLHHNQIQSSITNTFESTADPENPMNVSRLKFG